jgi:23S rRNA (adenine2503-C2)-methyltransferase
MQSIYNLSLADLKEYFINKGEKPYRSIQIFEWLYRFKVRSFDEMTNQKKSIIELLKLDFNLDLLELVERQISSDKTEKFLFRLEDGSLIETVLMNHVYGNSLCVTTQVGCNMNCAFCASGMHKKQRNLSTAEIILQVMSVSEIIGKRISHIVIMGIGEPFDNYDNVIKFMKIANEPKGLEIGARHISVSTCGLVPKIYDFAKEEMQSNLAISLHAPTNEVRNQIMPINKAYPLEVLIPAIKDYINATNRRVTLEYILLRDLNDTKECANKLADLIFGMNVYVNLIPYNEVREKPFKRSLPNAMKEFFDTLKKRGINVTLRQEQGHDIDAACGQLRSKKMNKDT